MTKDKSTAGKFTVSRGNPLPYGATTNAAGVNFSIFSSHATKAWLVIFESKRREPLLEIELDNSIHKTGDVWHILVEKLPLDYRYGWRFDGPSDAKEGHVYDPQKVLLDPMARALSGGGVWGESEIRQHIDEGKVTYEFPRRCCLGQDEFDWEGDIPPRIPLEDSVIYELHVRGYTVSPTSELSEPGTFKALAEKIPYLKDLGVTAVELMPVFEFDENEHNRISTETGEPLRNFWGYSPLAFFAPKASFAASGKDMGQVNEFRQMVKDFHKAGIEVLLDVVFNHTGEGDERGPTVSFRGIDNSVYYMIDEEGKYRNFSGCGNTFNCNNPFIRELILESLQYWVAQMHVDGFRFDLASILGRGSDGEVLSNPPLLERIAVDPVLADTKIIAEAWDAAGLYQVGTFPSWGRWAEWNGMYRDQIRMLWSGCDGMINLAASRICGSEDLYHPTGRSPYHSINFISAHDGFTLNDMVSYEKKHNLANGENNADGENSNHSVNFGTEGETEDQQIIHNRKQQMKNLCATLFLSQGVPMILGGDEFCRTQKGNNNPYCQDNEINWVDWSLVDKHSDMLRFFKAMIKFRMRHHALRREHFFHDSGDISWHGEKANEPEWTEAAKWLAFLLHGNQLSDGVDNHIYVMLNASDDSRHFEVPHTGIEWRKVIDTTQESPNDIYDNEEDAPSVGYREKRFHAPPKSLIVLVSANKP